MGKKSELVNRVPDEKQKPAVKKMSDRAFRLLSFLCFREVIGEWEALKDNKAALGKEKFKIEQGLRPSQIELYFYEPSGKLTRPFRAREVFNTWEEHKPDEFAKLAAELLNKEKIMIEPLSHKKGDYEKVLRIRAALGKPEKQYFDTKMTPTEQMLFFRKHELWNVEKGDVH